MGVTSANKQAQAAIIILIVSIVLSAFHFSSVNAAEEEASWTSLAPMPTARGGLGVAVTYGKICAIGGTNGNSTLTTNEEYDPTTNRWSTKAPMPTARSGFAIAVYENKIYCIGGTVGNSFIANTEVYDPVTDTWETKSSMPTPRADLSANLVNDKFYLIGGKKYSSTTPYYRQTDVNEVYDPVTDTWSKNAPLPTAVQGYASAVVDDKIYIIGGSKPSSQPGPDIVINANQIYDTKTDSWSNGANMNTLVSYGVAVATLGYMAPTRIYLLGGFLGNNFSNKTQVYNPDDNKWTNGTSMLTPRGYLSVTTINDILYAIGGFDGENWLNSNEQCKPLEYGKVPPKIQITSPENKTYNEVELAFTINRGTSWVAYSLDNQANVTLTGKVKLSGLSEGQHNIKIYANDTLGNMGLSNTVYFSVDTLAPHITILMPQNQSYGSTDIQLTFTVDESITKLSYSLDGQDAVVIVGNLTLPAMHDGSHRLTVYATDDLGNSGSSETVYFNVAPFPTFLVATIIATVTIVMASGYLFLKRRKLAN